MNVTAGLAARLCVLAIAAVFLQVAFVAQVPLFGATADISPLVIAGVGLLCGAPTAASMGFVVGLMLDIALLQTMGLTSLILLTVGWWAGRLREARDPQSPLTPIAVGCAAAAFATIGYGVGQFLLGLDSPLSWQLIKDILSTIVLETLLAVPVFAVVRRWLQPVLPDDPRRRRRRAYTTGGLSPLHRA